MNRVLAFDFGASSGRAMLARYDSGNVTVKEIHRFPNTPVTVGGTIYWDVLKLYDEIKTAIVIAVREGGFDSIGIDTWGIDFGILDRGGDLVGNPVTYRDSRTADMPAEVFPLVTKSGLYGKTGIQFMPMNTVYQLRYLFTKKKEIASLADKILLMPDLFAYFLTGVKRAEYTNATTTNLINAKEKRWDEEICRKIGIDTRVLPEIIMPGQQYGLLRASLAEELGCDRVPVIAVGTHDTASAVVGVPSGEKNFLFLSCGTWSLLGTELDSPLISDMSEKENFTNEGGCLGTIRFLKNIPGLWLIQELRRCLRKTDESVSFADIERQARESEMFVSFIDPDAPEFAQPGDLPAAVRAYCARTSQPVPATVGDIAITIYQSLALKYREVISRLSEITGKDYKKLYVVGGGIKDTFLCAMASDACDIEVSAGPSEATVMGNIAIQLISLGEIGSLAEARKLISDSVEIKLYQPRHTAVWDEAYTRFKSIIHNK